MAHRRDCPAAWEPDYGCTCGEDYGQRKHVSGCFADEDSCGSCTCDELIEWDDRYKYHPDTNPDPPRFGTHRPDCPAAWEPDYGCTCRSR